MKEKHKRQIEKSNKAVVPARRKFIIQGALSLGLGTAIGALQLRREPPVSSEDLPIRPPTANSNDLIFRQKCIRCGLCGLVCENGCIGFYGLDEMENGRLTPFIDVRKRSCTLCMRCTQVCPSGALEHTEKDLEYIAEHIHMGKALVDPDLCLSYLGRVCGFCHDACPIPQSAIKLVPPASPVILDGCVGCGRCVEHCPQVPTAIRIFRKVSA